MSALGGVWRKFVDLLPKTPRYVGVVLTVDGANRFTVTIVGGGLVTVIGSSEYSASDRVFVEGGKIVGTAPALTTLTIEV
jgi:hypothetical protein